MCFISFVSLNMSTVWQTMLYKSTVRIKEIKLVLLSLKILLHFFNQIKMSSSTSQKQEIHIAMISLWWHHMLVNFKLFFLHQGAVVFNISNGFKRSTGESWSHREVNGKSFRSEVAQTLFWRWQQFTFGSCLLSFLRFYRTTLS